MLSNHQMFTLEVCNKYYGKLLLHKLKFIQSPGIFTCFKFAPNP